MTDIVVRPARDADWPALWPSWHETVADGETYTFAPDTSYEDGRDLWLLSPPGETWLAERDGVLLGSYVLKPNQPGLGAHIANASYIVSAAARGAGVGRLLAEHSLDRARTAGYLAMQFNAVVATNETALRLWRSLGFAEVGRIPDGFRHPRLGLVDLVVMYRRV